MTTADLADSAPTPAALLARVTAMREVADTAEIEILATAVEWAHAHPVLDDEKPWKVGLSEHWSPSEYDPTVATADLHDVEWCGIPPVRWDAPAAFAAANQMSTTAGQALLRDALILCHRLPQIWARVLDGHVPAWRARRIAQAVMGSPADVVAALDAHLAPIAGTVGPLTVTRLIDEEMTRLHAELRELEQLEKLDARYVTLDERSIGHTGIADLSARADWKDLHDLDQTLDALAGVLQAHGATESHQVLRTVALGVLADPARAHALLTDQPTPAPTKRTVVFLHLSEAALHGHDTVGRNETAGRPELVQTLLGWCGRDDTHLTITPVIDLNDHLVVDAYEIPDRLKTRVRLTHTQCVFPWCTRPARACDCDHITPHATGGTTCTCNLAPLCRTHHRHKTYTAWTYRRLDPVTDPGTYLWTDPHGIRYLRQPTGTTLLTPPGPLPRSPDTPPPTPPPPTRRRPSQRKTSARPGPRRPRTRRLAAAA